MASINFLAPLQKWFQGNFYEGIFDFIIGSCHYRKVDDLSLFENNYTLVVNRILCIWEFLPRTHSGHAVLASDAIYELNERVYASRVLSPPLVVWLQFVVPGQYAGLPLIRGYLLPSWVTDRSLM